MVPTPVAQRVRSGWRPTRLRRPRRSVATSPVCGPLYTQVPGNIFETNRTIMRREVLTHFLFGEQRGMDLLPASPRSPAPR